MLFIWLLFKLIYMIGVTNTQLQILKYKHPNLNLNTILNLKFGLKPLTALREPQTFCCLTPLILAT